ncbi:MAG: IS91 family transposase, partial [Gammaproteobacteria bacterium]
MERRFRDRETREESSGTRSTAFGTQKDGSDLRGLARTRRRRASGAEIARYHSCRNRHCPKCQTLAKERWVEARCAELLPVPYFHLVFTLPHEINSLAQGNPRVIDNLLFQAASDALQAFGRDPKWLGGEIGITMVLHT